MVSRHIRRRRLLQLGGAALATTAAGCLGGDSGSGNGNGNGNSNDNSSGNDKNTASTPAYADWVAAVDPEGSGDKKVTISYIDIAGFNEFESEDSDSSNETNSLEDIEDPMLAVPISGMLFGMLTAGFGLMGTRLGGLVAVDEEQTSQNGFDSTVNELLTANEASVMIGDIDTDEIDTTVTAAPENSFGATQFEHTGDTHGYAVYEPVDGGTQETTLAVSSDAIVHGANREIVEAVLKTKQGDRTRAVDEFATFKRLLSTGGNGHVVFGGYSPDGFTTSENQSDGENQSDVQFSTLEDANGFVGSMTFSESGGSADMGIEFDELDETTRSDLKSTLGKAGSDASVSFDNGFVSASATYADGALKSV